MNYLTSKTNKKIDQFTWELEKNHYQITFETQVSGQPILLLPAFSKVSSRSEMSEIGENSPPYSLSEMVAISELPNIKTTRLAGTLGMAEEFATLIAPLIA